MALSLNMNTDNSYNVKQSFTLNGEQYILRLYWNVRSGWYLRIASDEDVEIVGVKVMPNKILLQQHQYLNPFNGGQLVCVDTDPQEGVFIEKDNVGEGKRYQIWYYTQEELRSYGVDL